MGKKPTDPKAKKYYDDILNSKEREEINYSQSTMNKDYKELCEEVDSLYKTVPFIKEITSREKLLVEFDY